METRNSRRNFKQKILIEKALQTLRMAHQLWGFGFPALIEQHACSPPCHIMGFGLWGFLKEEAIGIWDGRALSTAGQVAFAVVSNEYH